MLCKKEMVHSSPVVAREAVLAQVADRWLSDFYRVSLCVPSLLSHVRLVQRSALDVDGAVDLGESWDGGLGPWCCEYW